MRLLVNALVSTNFSGKHVLLGHLAQLAAQTDHHIHVLYHAGNADICRDFGSRITWEQCPNSTQHWSGRVRWEAAHLPKLAAQWRADAWLNPSGGTTPTVALPQLPFARHPWALVPGVAQGWRAQLKARLQRRAYRHTVAQAHTLIGLSAYIRDAYFANAQKTCPAVVVYPGLDDALWRAAKTDTQPKQPLRILSVSAMAPHKDVLTLLHALEQLRTEYAVPAELRLVGPWPDTAYQHTVRQRIQQLKLTDAVTITGNVSVAQLHAEYAQASVFCLMSRCESFGIPAVEAQAFGTPVVSSNCCAIPEVCGASSHYPPPGDSAATAAALLPLLTQTADWHNASQAARINAARYDWATTSRPLIDLLNTL